MSDSENKIDIHNLPIADGVLVDILAHLENIRNEPDRSAVLIVGGIIERFLSYQISKTLLKNEGGKSMSNLQLDKKIQLSYGLGLLTDNDYQELIFFKDLRNKMAHSWEIIDFNNLNIRSSLSKLGNYGVDKPFKDYLPRNYFNIWVSIFVISLVIHPDVELPNIIEKKENLASRMLVTK
ncbi:hypothetical protein LVY74_17095 [Acinetobacter sp. ME22]|uniref:hypothetical protein n=1 Tax=Acinetobacter sp. ME22 TaxID=2904802 RepID=UPI001ED9D55E|nr:hypothetical protein [Acinetobacter sp. ME22]MCG2575255.1 hypothetical protein [Acinetobacter sp. ME22]